MKKAKIIIPSSSANVGIYFDNACLALANPELITILTRLPNKYGITIEAISSILPPAGRNLKEHNIKEGVHVVYEDSGYPVGGLGRSGAEAVGAVMAAAVVFDIKLTRAQIVKAAAKGEPGEHMDNVAGSTNGKFNLITRSPATNQLSVAVYDVPDNLGIAIGNSSHQKTTGTEGMRTILQKPVSPKDFIEQGGLIAGATAALISADVDKFLEYTWGDRFHEPRRADIDGYGKFSGVEFKKLKTDLFNQFHIALNVSGAGPNMQFLYNKDQYPHGVLNNLTFVREWFGDHGVVLDINETRIAQGGGYDYALLNYNYGKKDQ